MTPEEKKLLVDLLIAAIGAAGGTIAGAWLALRGDRQKRERETEDRNVTAANIAIFDLGRIYGYLIDYENRIIKQHEANEDYWYQIPRSLLKHPEIAPLDAPGISFLFETSDPNLPGLIAIEHVKFAALLQVIALAHSLYNDEAQARIEDAATFAGPPDTPEEIEIACGDRISITLRRYSDNIIEQNRHLSGSIVETALRIHSVVTEKYPGRKVMRFTAVNTPVTVDVPWYRRPARSIFEHR